MRRSKDEWASVVVICKFYAHCNWPLLHDVDNIIMQTHCVESGTKVCGYRK